MTFNDLREVVEDNTFVTIEGRLQNLVGNEERKTRGFRGNKSHEMPVTFEGLFRKVEIFIEGETPVLAIRSDKFGLHITLGGMENEQQTERDIIGSK